MGTYHRLAGEPKRKHIFISRLPVMIRLVDRDAWETYIEGLSDRYEMRELSEDQHFVHTELVYTARGANAHDLKRKLDGSQLSSVPGVNSRLQICECERGARTCTSEEPNIT